MFKAISLTFLSAWHHIGLMIRSRRMLAVVLVVGFAPLMATLALDPSKPMDHLRPISIVLYLSILAPLAGLIMGSSVLSEDIEAKTLTFLFTRPIPRASLFVGRWLACVVLTCALLSFGAWFMGNQAASIVIDAGSARAYHMVPEGYTARFVWASFLAGAMYTTIAAGLSTFVRRPVVIGLGYAFVLEMLVANIPGSTQRMSMQFYLRGILFGGETGQSSEMRGFAIFESLSPMDSSVRLVIAIALLLIVSAWVVRKRQYLLSS